MREAWRYGVLAASLGGLAGFLWMHEAAPVAPVAAGAVAVSVPVSAAWPSSAAGQTTLDGSVPPHASKSGVSSAPASTAATASPEAWAAAFTSPQPVAEMLRLRSARVPGSFAISKRLAVACNVAWLNANAATADPAPSVDPMAQAQNRPFYAERLQAQAKITARCAAMRQYENIANPLTDDHDGIAFEKALAQQWDFAPATQRAIAQELARQGSLHFLHPLGIHWKGQDLELELLRDAVSLGGLLATSSPGEGANDIRLLNACVTTSRCTADYTEYWFMGKNLDPAKRKQIEALAQDMAAAMRAGEYQKFVP